MQVSKYNNLRYYIDSGLSDNYNMENLTKTKLTPENVVLPIGSILEKYMGIIKERCSKITLNEEEKDKYFYRPKLLSFDLYNTTELWFLLLKVNNMFTTSDFNKETIVIFNPSEIKIINDIIVKENFSSYTYI